MTYQTKNKPAEVISPEIKLDGTWLMALLQDTSLPGGAVLKSGQMPNPQKVAAAAQTLTGARRACSRKRNEQQKRETAEHDEYVAALQVILKHNAPEPDWPEFAHSELYNSVRRELEEIDRGIPFLPPQPVEHWRDIAHGLADVFDTLTRPKKWGTTNDGPKARFCAAVIPYIIGGAPTPANVAEHLKTKSGNFRKRKNSGRN